MEASSSATASNSFIEHRPEQYDCKNLSRRSVDWRDSGIVIEDDQQFLSAEGLGDYSNGCIQPSLSSIPDLFSPVERIVYNQDDDGDTILHLAVVGFTCDKVKDLIKICNLDAINNMMQTPLHVATIANRPEMVELLVKAGARVDVHDRKGNTPLHLACQKGHLEICAIILNSIRQQDAKSTQACLSIEQLIDMTNFDGQTCLHLAATNNRQDVIDMLVKKYDANPNTRDSRSGDTILHKAIQTFNTNLIAFILNLDKHCNEANYSSRRPSDMIRMLQESVTDESHARMLFLADKLINERIAKCIEQKGCCERLKLLSETLIDSSSSSSDYTDSETELY